MSAENEACPVGAPKHALAEIRADFHRIVYVETATAAHAAYVAFERKRTPRCPGVLRSLQEGGEELLTFFQFPKRSGRRCAPLMPLSGCIGSRTAFDERIDTRASPEIAPFWPSSSKLC